MSLDYNKAPSGVFKNAFDWISRVPSGVWKGKPVAVITAAAGRTGGETAQYMLRASITAFGPRLITTSVVCLAQAGDQIDHNGRLTSEKDITPVTALMAPLRPKLVLKIT